MRRWFGALVLMSALLATARPASAHAFLIASDPAAGAMVARAPQSVTLTFDEPVETSLGSIRVLDAAGAVRSAAAIRHPGGDARRVAVRLDSIGRGRYVVTWQVVSADSHLVGGAFAFGVGVPAGEAPLQQSTAAAATLLAIVHFVILAGALLAIGLPIAAFAIGGGRRRTPTPVEFIGWLVLAFAAFADISLRADLTGGSLGAAMVTRVGALRLVTVAAALLAALAVARRQRDWLVLIPAGAVATVALSLAGHAADATPLAGVPADALHFFAAATWVGVLAIGTTMKPGPELRRISPIAATAVGAIVVTGVVQTVRNAGSWQALVTTAYGREIDLKIVLLIVALGIALSVRRTLASARFAVGRRINGELLVLTAVVGVTAVLVETPLPRDIAPATRATASFAVRSVAVSVTATSAGARTWTFAVIGRAPAGDASSLDGVDITVRETRRNVGPIHVPVTREPTGQFSGTIVLPFAGAWVVRISARSGDFDEAHQLLDLPED